MEVTTISTSVPDTAAAIVTVAPNSTHVPQKVTVVWSARRHSCGHTIAHQPAGQVPELFDQTGTGAWATNTGVHCPQCGSRFSIPARVVTRALERAEIDEIASEVAAWAADNQ